ncbi:transcription antiterminator [Fusobacterium perfoetens]|uniref:BglG family transcription antiterminator n=1 Tax=Fusobacterium TaxID=848 RepID=UPI0014776E62|nr:PTS sugar transporter subunit IIA [Fusobacterium perfoetens]NME35335.1 transcription antiterminator [Fusobacterium sp. FSA-380-WT-3A]
MLGSKGNNILRNLCNNQGKGTIKKLSTELEISERSIRYELEKIDDYLKSIKMKPLKREFGGNIYFEEYKIFLENQIIVEESNLDTAERREYLSFICVFDEKINLTKASEILDVSRTTIRNDIRDIKEELSKNNLKLKISQQEGLILSGEEIDIRKQQLKFLCKYSNFIFYSNPEFKNKKETIVEEYIKCIDINIIKNFINYIQKILDKIISDEAYNIIAIYLIIAIIRIKQGKLLTKIPNKQFLKETDEYDTILKAKSILESSYDIILEENEILQITDYFLGSHTYNFNKSYYRNWIEIDILVKKFIDNFNKKIDVDISKDKLLLEGILNHIKPTIYRLKNKIKLENSIYLEVLNSYPTIFYNTKNAVKEIEEYTNLEFSNDEIAFLAIYFKSAIDRNRYKSKNLKKVLVVCGYGYGTSSLLVQQLKEIYTIKIVDTIPRHLLEKTIKKENVDLIISTVEIENDINIPVVKVKSILTQEDINNIDKYSLSKQRKRYMLSELMSIIEENCEIRDREELIKGLNIYFEQRLINDTEGNEYKISDFLKEKNILLNQEAENWEEAVKISGQILVDNKITTEKYIDSMVENVKRFGSYIVIGENIAIPHAQKDESVLKTGMGLVVLKKPVIFPGDRKVQILLSFSSKDDKEHLNALTDLIELISNYNFIENMLKVKTIKQALKYINFQK